VKSAPWNGPRTNDVVSDIAVDSTNGFIVAGDKIYTTYDSGKTWQYRSEGGLVGSPLTVDKEGTAFAAPYDMFEILDSNRFYGSLGYLDSGLVNTGFYVLSASVNSFIFGGAPDGIYRLREGDPVWTKCSATPAKVLFSSFIGDVYAGSSNGILKSTDNGDSWKPINDGLPSTLITSITGDAHENIYSASDKGAFILKSNSTRWEDISDGLDLKDVRALAWSNKDELFAGTNGKGVYKISTATFKKVPSVTEGDLSLFVYFNQESGKIELQSSSYFGETTASLYTIDGRLLRRQNINIAAPGNYEFDASGIRSQFGFLVLQTAKGVIARKILF
jgi:hypothetical protein